MLVQMACAEQATAQSPILKARKEHLRVLHDDLVESDNLPDPMPERAKPLRKNIDAYCHRGRLGPTPVVWVKHPWP